MISSLITNLEHLDIILASASPRRYELLSTIGIKFKVIHSGFNEKSVKSTDPQTYVSEVAYNKGYQVAVSHPDFLVISADTIVVDGGKILGKPEDEEDAFKMLLSLSGREHQVLTAFGLFLLKYDKTLVETVSTLVTMRELSNDEIWAYVNGGEPLDKAGAYAIQGQGALLVEKINGCYSNVVGFPLSKFYSTLDHFLNRLALQEEK